jgi:type I restriction enzyme S subunit
MQYKTLDSLCKVASGGTPSRSKKEYWDGGDIPWIKIGNIKSKVVSNADEYITEAGLNNSSAKLFKKGTILYTIFATLGEVGILDFDACTNQAIAGISIEKTEEITTDYLYYYLKSKKAEVNQIGRGVAQNNINLSILRKFSIPMRDIDEQKTIVDSLNKVESIIEKQKRQLEQLDELIKARFVEMFGDGFETTELRNICKTTSGGTPSTKNPDYYNGTIPWVTTTALGPNHINGTKAKAYISEEAVANSATKIIPSGSILFGIRVGVGKTSINDVDICTNQDIVAIMDVNETKFSKLFIKHVLDANRAHYDSLKKGATILGITSDDLKNTLIPLAPIKAQKDFETFVEQVDKSKFAVQKSLEKTQLLFDSLMQEYFG